MLFSSYEAICRKLNPDLLRHSEIQLSTMKKILVCIILIIVLNAITNWNDLYWTIILVFYKEDLT